MKDICFQSLHTIDKLIYLRQRAKQIEKEYIANQRKFTDFIEEMDDENLGDDTVFERRMSEINVIMSKSDELFFDLETINQLLNETSSMLNN
jgi:hypothetical protein